MDKDYLKKYLGKAYKLKGSTDCPPLFVTEVSEQIADKDICNESSGFLLFSKDHSIIKLRVKWFHSSSKNTGFEESLFFEEELEEYNLTLRYQFSDWESFTKELGLSVNLPLKFVPLKGLNQVEEKWEDIAPRMVLLDILRNNEQSKYGNLTIIRPELLLKCKWYNKIIGKFQEVLLPKEFFIQPIE